MRKSCVQSVYSMVACCVRTHHLYAHCRSLVCERGYYRLVIPRVMRTMLGLLCTGDIGLFPSVMSQVFPTIHMTNNNYNSVYIPI
jgi:hypothetical protein